MDAGEGVGHTLSAPAVAPKFLTDDAVKFLKQFFAGTMHNIELRAIPVPGKPVSQMFSRTPAEIRAFIEEHTGQNLYFGVSTRVGGKAVDCKELPALFCDVDSNDAEAQNRIECFIPVPSVVNFTGGGYHLFWMLREPLDAQDPRIVPLLKGLCAAIGGDPACKDVSRILRIPGTLNYKPKYKTPREVFLAKEDWGVKYTLDAFAEFLPAASPSQRCPTPRGCAPSTATISGIPRIVGCGLRGMGAIGQ
jgi:RepB DNA-primase from phage plasmid